MKRFYQFPVPTTEPIIDATKSIVFLGSCFSENIGFRCEELNYFNTLINPFGTLFNPKSIEQTLQFLYDHKSRKSIEKMYVINDDIYLNYYFHSDVRGYTKLEFDQKLSDSISKTKELLSKEEGSIVYITLGTAGVHQLKQSQTIVANCHKQNQSFFDFRLLTLDEIESSLVQIVKSIKRLSANNQVIFTLSPVKYLKYGPEQNFLSKSLLKVAIQQTINFFKEHEDVEIGYFPAYEIMQDELRDYQFYKQDFAHPNALAINRIWEIFSTKYFSKSTTIQLKKVIPIINGLNHIPFNKYSAKHFLFLLDLREKAIKVSNKNKHFNRVIKLIDKRIDETERTP